MLAGRALDPDEPRLRSQIEEAGGREDESVALDRRRLYRDPRGPHGMYGLSKFACGGPRTSGTGDSEDSYLPHKLLKRLEGSAKGCELLIDDWKLLLHRLEKGLEWQSHDRLKGIRMLGKQPVDAVEDERVALIFLASFARHPLGRENAYEDLKSDMGTVDLENFLERIRSRWPLLLSTHDSDKAQQVLLDLVASNVERLEAKLEVHKQYAEEGKARAARSLGYEATPEGERLRRYELASQRRAHRCLDAFWKHRANAEDGGERAEDGGRRAEDGEEGCEGGNATDFCLESGVALEASLLENKKCATEPNLELSASEVGTDKEVEALAKEIELASKELSAARDGGIELFARLVAGGAPGLTAVQRAISARGPLLRPIC